MLKNNLKRYLKHMNVKKSKSMKFSVFSKFLFYGRFGQSGSNEVRCGEVLASAGK